MSKEEQLRFWSVQAVDAWAREHGGEDAVHNLLARGARVFAWYDKTSPQMLRAWLELQGGKRADAADRANIAVAERSARAAESSARWAAVAAVASILGGVAGLMGALIPLFTASPPGTQVHAQPAPPASATSRSAPAASSRR